MRDMRDTRSPVLKGDAYIQHANSHSTSTSSDDTAHALSKCCLFQPPCSYEDLLVSITLSQMLQWTQLSTISKCNDCVTASEGLQSSEGLTGVLSCSTCKPGNVYVPSTFCGSRVLIGKTNICASKERQYQYISAFSSDDYKFVSMLWGTLGRQKESCVSFLLYRVQFLDPVPVPLVSRLAYFSTGCIQRLVMELSSVCRLLPSIHQSLIMLTLFAGLLRAFFIEECYGLCIVLQLSVTGKTSVGPFSIFDRRFPAYTTRNISLVTVGNSVKSFGQKRICYLCKCLAITFQFLNEVHSIMIKWCMLEALRCFCFFLDMWKHFQVLFLQFAWKFLVGGSFFNRSSVKVL